MGVILRGYIIPTRAFVIRTGEKNYSNTAMLSSSGAG
jgi:c-di-AMP phosphodiesterase-like protein